MWQNCCNTRASCNRTCECWRPAVIAQPTATATPVTNTISEANTTIEGTSEAVNIPFAQIYSNSPFTVNTDGVTITGYSTYLISYRINAQTSSAANIVIDFLYNNQQVYPPGGITFNTTQNPSDTSTFLGSASNSFTLNTGNPTQSVLLNLAISSTQSPITVNADWTIVGLA